MNVTLLQCTPLNIAVEAALTCTASVDKLEERMRAYEKAQIDCRLELAKGYPTREETLRLAERLDNHATRLVILEERDLAA